MRRSLLLALLVSALLAGCGSGDPAAFDDVQPSEIAGRVAAGEVLLVDVREPDEWRAGHAPKAIHVPLATVGRNLDEIRSRAAGRPIAFICRSGRRSAQAARIALDGGLEGVINVDGGMGSWVEAGLPIEPAGGRII